MRPRELLIPLLLSALACSEDTAALDSGLPRPAADAAARDAAAPDAATNPPVDQGLAADATAPGDAAGADATAPDEGEAPDAGDEPPCTDDAPCSVGACLGGPNCEDAWQCDPSVACTEDLQPYCGCDGVTFTGSGSCPPKPFVHRGECAPSMGVNCDRRNIACRQMEPVCPDGETAMVIGDCYGPCVPIADCVCTEPAACPHPDRYTCHAFRGRCGPFL